MASTDDEMVAFRLAARDRAAIVRLVESGEFRNRSDFFRYAVKSTLAEYEGEKTRARIDLELGELEGVDLPAHAPARAGKARGRSSKGVNL